MCKRGMREPCLNPTAFIGFTFGYACFPCGVGALLLEREWIITLGRLHVLVDTLFHNTERSALNADHTSHDAMPSPGQAFHHWGSRKNSITPQQIKSSKMVRSCSLNRGATTDER